ncbi:MAG: hypothetical protein WAL14_02835 [Pseudolabrys sp.]
MLKTIAAIVAAAVIAAMITIISAPIGDVVASPLPKPAADAIAACKQNHGPTSIVSAPNLAIQRSA